MKSLQKPLSLFLLITALSSMLLPVAYAQEESPAQNKTVTHTLIPIALFTDKTGGILGITPITDDLFLWAYATSTDNTATTSYDTDGTTPQKHILTPDGQVIATVKGTGASASVYYDHTDNLTGSNALTDTNAGMVQLLDYYPYGAMRIDWAYSSAFDEQRKYIGQEYDRDTALSYLNARYYNDAQGRFISEDSST